MKWYFIPTAILIIGLIGLYLNIKSYKKGESISLKKLVAAFAFIILGTGVFLQKMKVVNVSQFEQLLLAFDQEEREKIQEQKNAELEKVRQEMKDRMLDVSKKANKIKNSK